MPSKKKITKKPELSVTSDKENGENPAAEGNDPAASSEEEMDDEDDRSSNVGSTKEIEVEFEAWPILDTDYDAIKAFLQQTFQSENINLPEITECIIAQSSIGCIYKPSLVDNPVDEESDDGEDPDMAKLTKAAGELEIDDDDIYGVMTSLNLTKLKDKEFAKQLMKLLAKKCKNEKVWKRFDVIWSNPSTSIGWIISERFVNIPYQISLPSFKSLKSDIAKSCKDDPASQPTHYLLLSKCHRMPAPHLGKSKVPKPAAAASESDVIYSNPEDEFLIENGLISFEYKAKKKSDKSLVAGKPENECELESWRKVVLLDAQGLDSFLESLEKDIGQE